MRFQVSEAKNILRYRIPAYWLYYSFSHLA